MRDNSRAPQHTVGGGTGPNAAIQGQVPEPQPPVCLHSPVQHEINIERSIAGRVHVAAVAHARLEEEEENDEQEDSIIYPDPNHGGPHVSCQQLWRDTVIPSRDLTRVLCRWLDLSAHLLLRICAALPAALGRQSQLIDAGVGERRRQVFSTVNETRLVIGVYVYSYMAIF